MIAVLVLACLPVQDVEGRVLGPDKPPPRVAKRYTDSPDAPWVRGPAIVFIDGVRGVFPPPARPAVLEQRNRQFTPLAMPILKGTTVEFPNRDDEHHNVFSRSTARQLELGRYGKAETKTVTLSPTTSSWTRTGVPISRTSGSRGRPT